MARETRLTPKQFRAHAEALARLAEMKGATFEADTPAKRVRRVALAVVSPESFNRTYLPTYFRDEPAAFHSELYRAAETSRRLVVRCPRLHAKTTVLTQGYTLHQVVCARILKSFEDGRLQGEDPALHAAIMDALAELGRDPSILRWDPFIQVVMVTMDDASDVTAAIRAQLDWRNGEGNPLIRSDFGDLTPENDAKDDWIANGVRVKAHGMEGNIRGGKHGPWRPTLCIVDDPDSRRTVQSQSQRDAQFSNVMGAARFGLDTKKGRIWVVGTPLHSDCVVCRLTADGKFPAWTKIRYRARKEDGTPLWPEMHSDASLAEAQAEDPETYASEMDDTPPNAGDRPFTAISTYSRATYANITLPVVMAFDPSMGKRKSSDYQAVIVVRGPTPEGWLLVHRAELLRIGDPQQLVKAVLDIYAEERPDLAVLEAIGFQSLLETMMNMVGDQTGLFAAWTKIERQEDGKDLRIRSLAPLINQGRLLLPDDNSAAVLRRQLESYPDGKKDGPDALEMAIRHMRRPPVSQLLREIQHVRGRGASFGGGW